MFRTNKTEERVFIRDGVEMPANEVVLDYIFKLEAKIDDIRYFKECAENELKAIKPVIESGKLKPAVTSHCLRCKFCVKSSWSGEVLGCNRDSVCDDFVSKE